MKKVVLFFAVVAAFALASCDQPQPTPAVEPADSTNVTEQAVEVADSMVQAAADTLAAAGDSMVQAAADTLAAQVAE